jgi:hypothetical protein
MPPDELRKRIRWAIQAKFKEAVIQVKAGPSSLKNFAAQISVTRQALSAYADGSVPEADVLLAALLIWDWEILIQDEGCQLGCRPFKVEGESAQLSLFDESNDLESEAGTGSTSASGEL